MSGRLAGPVGYENASAAPVTIAIGAHNKFKPAPSDRGQPTTFDPGVHTAVTGGCRD